MLLAPNPYLFKMCTKPDINVQDAFRFNRLIITLKRKISGILMLEWNEIQQLVMAAKPTMGGTHNQESGKSRSQLPGRHHKSISGF